VDVQGRIKGYCFGRRGHNFEHLGPVIAHDLSTAQQLVSACLREQIGRPVLLDAALHNDEWVRWLGAIGFTSQRSFIRMFRGLNRFPGLPSNQFAILGPEFG
jgi:Acetyltransferase (GNAT) domain